MIESVEGSLADALAFSLALWGIVVWRRRPWLAVALFTLAALGRETTLVAPLACALVAQRGHRVRILAPLAAFAAWAVTVSVWLPATPSGGSSNLVDDASVAFDWPFAAWAKTGIGSQAVFLGATLVVAALAAAQLIRDRLPEISLWLLAEAGLLIVSSEPVMSRAQNFARVAPLALAALALALAGRVARQAPKAVPDLARGPT
jgi:hypothetical protein